MMTFDNLTPTGLSDLAYCPTGRLFYMNKRMPNNGVTTKLTVIGKFEHSVIEQFYKLTKIDWKELDAFQNDKKLDSRISLAVQDSIEVSRKNFPLFFDCLEENLDPITYRLKYLNEIKSQQIKKLLKKGISYDSAVNITLPFVIEKWLSSKKYGIRGIADLLFYNADGSITIEDIKSHNDMYDAFIHRSAHVAQGNTYAILAEEVYGKPVKQFQIFYSMDCHTETFKITKQSKQKVIDSIKDAQAILQDGLPPKLEGLQKLKCRNCYKRNFCFSLNKSDSQEASS
jgi:CRISPR/Cas system-associated exonuclease Cas4 (RecB family)